MSSEEIKKTEIASENNFSEMPTLEPLSKPKKTDESVEGSAVSTSGEGNKLVADVKFSLDNPALKDGDSKGAFNFNEMSKKKPKLSTKSVSIDPMAKGKSSIKGEKKSMKSRTASAPDPGIPPVKATPSPRPAEKTTPKPSPAPAPEIPPVKTTPSPRPAEKTNPKRSPGPTVYRGITPLFVASSSDEKDDKSSPSTTHASGTPSSNGFWSSILNKSPKEPEKKPVKRWSFPENDSCKFDDTPRISYDDLREDIKERHEELENWLKQLIDNNEMLPMPFRPSSPEHKNDKFIRVAPEDVKGKEVWFLGDIHGDLLSFTAALQTAFEDKSSPNDKVIVLLGDVFDRLSDYFEAFYLILWNIYKQNNIVWLSGNHDFVTYDESTDKFYSPTKPSEFTEWLNDPKGGGDELHPVAREITKLFSKLIDSLPAAMYFPDGLFVSHGGFPHPHWYEAAIKKWDDFNNRNFVTDFYWKRLHETKRHTLFGSGKGGDLGYEDFDSFCDLLENRFMSPISVFLRGHDHFAERVKYFDNYKKPVITINTICCTQDGCDPLRKHGYQTSPVIVKYNPKIPDNYVSYAKLDDIIEKISPLEAEQAQIAEEQKELEAKIADKQRDHEAIIAEKQRNHDAIIAEEKRTYEAKIAEERTTFEKKLAEAKSIFEAKIAEEKRIFEAKIAEENRTHEAIIAEEQKNLDAIIAEEQKNLDAVKARKAHKEFEVQKTLEELKAGVEPITGVAPKVDEEPKGLEE